MTTFDETKVRRVQQGVSGGGQFATKPKSETSVELAPAAAAIEENRSVAIRNPWSGGPAWLLGNATQDVPGFPARIGVRVPGSETVYVKAVDEVLVDVAPAEYDGDDVDTLASVFGWSATDWERYYDAREEREQEEAFEAGQAAVAESGELAHPAGVGTVQTWVGEDGVPVFQIDTHLNTGRIRVNLNDGPPLYDGDPERDSAADVEALQAAHQAQQQAAESLMKVLRRPMSSFEDDDQLESYFAAMEEALSALGFQAPERDEDED